MAPASKRWIIAFCVLYFVRPVDAWSQAQPVPVSPGHATPSRSTASLCPTFSWAAVPGAAAYEVVAFELPGGLREGQAVSGQDLEPVVREVVPGTATSWTVSAPRCLEADGRYGWTLRVLDGDRAGEWSEVLLFETEAFAGAGEVARVVEAVVERMGQDGRIDGSEVEVLVELIRGTRSAAEPRGFTPARDRSERAGTGEAPDPEARFQPVVEEPFVPALGPVDDEEAQLATRAAGDPDATLGTDLQLRSSSGVLQFFLDSATGTGADLEMFDNLGASTIELDSQAAEAKIRARDLDGLGHFDAVRLMAEGSANSSGRLLVRGQPQAGGTFTTTFEVLATEGGSGDGAQLFMRRMDGLTTVDLDAEFGGEGSSPALRLFTEDSLGTQVETVRIEAREGNVDNGAQIVLSKRDGTASIILDAEVGAGGNAQIETQVLRITGGADVSEQFRIAATGGADPEPGTLVSIDPAGHGGLRVTSAAYDRGLVGVVSGAGGLHPGMLMGQRGSEADGELPVALTGRVYVRADAAHGAIRPGDLLTSAPTPGLAMRASDAERAQGAILGKAMTSLSEGQGLVLALISLQ